MSVLIAWRRAAAAKEPCRSLAPPSLSSIGSMRLYRSCGNAFNSYSNGFITGDIFLQNDSPPLFPPPHSPPAHSHSCSDSHYALSTKLNFQPEPFKCLECWKWPWFYPLHKTAWRRTRRRKALFLNEISVMHSGALHALLIPLQSFCPLADRCQREAAALPETLTFLWREKKSRLRQRWTDVIAFPCLLLGAACC